jgi:ATP-dependent RNA helicase DDX3X
MGGAPSYGGGFGGPPAYGGRFTFIHFLTWADLCPIGGYGGTPAAYGGGYGGGYGGSYGNPSGPGGQSSWW